MKARVAGFTFAALLAVQAASAQAPNYGVYDLGRLPGAYATHPMRINDRMEIAGWVHGPQTLYRAFVWRPGHGMVELPPPTGYTHNRATGISDNGIVTGVAQVGFDGRPRSWRWRDGKYDLLPELTNGCYPLFANGVNNDGTVVGRTVFIDGCPVKAFYFSDATGLVLFDALDAIDVNNNGIATGEGFGSAYRFSPQTGYEPIGTLPPGYDDSAQGRAINDSNEVAGKSINAIVGPDPWRAFLYTDGTGMQNISDTVAARSAAEGLNDHGDVVGNDGSLTSPEMWAWIWTAGGGRQLFEDIITRPNGFVSVMGVRDIDDSRRMIAMASSSNGADQYAYGVVLVPDVPETPQIGSVPLSGATDDPGRDDATEK